MEKEKLIHTFSGGFSGSKVELIKTESNKIFVRKTGSVDRNYERMMALYDVASVPKVFRKEMDVLDMEYIVGLDMDTYLSYNSIEPLVSFLTEFIQMARKDTTRKDYTEAYELAKVVDYDIDFDFSYSQLLEKLPRYLPQTKFYHGDMTLENIIYSTPYFVFIDPVQTPFDSWAFDIAKLRQDLESKWFLRHSTSDLTHKLYNIQRQLLRSFPLAKNDYLLILMLLRVYRYTEFGSPEANLLQKECNRLWKQNS